MLKEVLTAPTEELGKWSRFAIFQLKLWRQCARLLRQNRSGQQAAALSYHTIFGIVPLAIVILMVFQLFPAYRDTGENVKVFLYEQMHLSNIEYPIDDAGGSIKLTDKIDEITETFIERLDKGSITFFSGLIVILAALGLLTTIERAFNNIWHVARPRSFVHRIINYWALLTLGPLLLGLGIYISTHYLMMVGLREGAIGYLRPVLPFIISTVSLFLLYFVMPNTKVNTRSALWGAAVASLIWTLAKHLFGAYVTKFIPYSQVYGIMGLIPLSVFWIFITWWIVLFGLQLTFATQHLKTLDAAELVKMDKSREHFLANDFTVIRILGYIMEAFEQKKAPVPAEVICGGLNLPADFGEEILSHLTEAGLLFRTSEPRIGYSPSANSENITLGEICDAVAKASFAQDDDNTPAALRKLMHASRQELSGVTLGHILRDE
jgi:membrane protein